MITEDDFMSKSILFNVPSKLHTCTATQLCTHHLALHSLILLWFYLWLNAPSPLLYIIQVAVHQSVHLLHKGSSVSHQCPSSVVTTRTVTSYQPSLMQPICPLKSTISPTTVINFQKFV